MPALLALLTALRSFARSRLELEAEILALRHQLAVLQARRGGDPGLVLEITTTTGRPAVGADIRALIRQVHAVNPLWGAPRIHGELH